MNLIIDVGNTATKLAIFLNENLIATEIINHSALVKKVTEMLHSHPDITEAILSSVGEFDVNELAALSNLCSIQVLDYTMKIPFKNCYASPQTLGADRIALATAAFYEYPNNNCLIIDAGSCITFDMLTKNGEYLGGAISPGVTMRYKAMHNQTSKLPYLEKHLPEDLIGNSTETSMHSGVFNGVRAEIDGVIDEYKSRYADLTVILTGGDAQFLSKRLKNTIFADSNFLLRGLNNLLEYNKR